MKNDTRRLGYCTAILALSVAIAWAEATTTTKKSSSGKTNQPAAPKAGTSAPANTVIYKPAAGSAPAARVTGGSRGTGDATVRLDVLAPDETGLTTQEQPSLFWYQSKPAEARFELTLLEEDKTKPLLQVKMDRSLPAGIQRIKLSDYNIKLQADVEYRWVVALVLDPANRSNDLVASGFIKRVQPSKELQEELSKASVAERPAIYAGAGIWHDALAGLSDLIDAEPSRETWRLQRANLLKQVGLDRAAAAEAGKG